MDCPHCGKELVALRRFEHSLTRSQRVIFEEMLKAKGKTVRKDHIAWVLYQGQDEPEGALKVIDQMVYKIRKKLSKHNVPMRLDTIFGGELILRSTNDGSSNDNQGSAPLDK